MLHRSGPHLGVRKPFGSVHTGPAIQSGYGVGSFIGGLFKKILSLGKKAAQSSIGKEVISTAKDAALSTGINVMSDVISGKKPVKESISKNLTQSRQDLAEALQRGLKHKKQEKQQDLGGKKDEGKKVRKRKNASASSTATSASAAISEEKIKKRKNKRKKSMDIFDE